MAISVSPEQLKSFIPFGDLTDEIIQGLIDKSDIVEVKQGKMIFKRDEEDKYYYWLLSGSLDLLDEKFNAKPLKAGEEGSQFSVDNNSPHKLTAVSTATSAILKLEKFELDLMIGWDHSTSKQTQEAEDEVDWMSSLLSSPLFEFIPPANIQTLFAKFEEIAYESGEKVIKQGDEGDYFYVIQSGKAKVERSSGGKTVILAELNPGANFGQEALISDMPRNATVTMLTAGVLMRLSEADFESLLMKPVIEWITLQEAQEMIAAADPKTYILDVRAPKELESGKIDGSLNVPLLLLRKNLGKLKPDAIYVTACDGGKRSELASYLLLEHGFSAYVLRQDTPVSSPAQSNGES